MRKVRVVALALMAAIIGYGSNGLAEPKQRTIAGWLVMSDDDPFGDGKKVIAAKPEADSFFLVRCINDELSIAVRYGESFGKKFDPGKAFGVKFRADRKPIIDTSAVTVDELMVLLLTTSDMVKQLRDAQQVALRFLAPLATFDAVFNMAGARLALAPVIKECPLN